MRILEILKGLIQFILFLMGKFNSKVKKIERQTISWNELCSTFEGPLYPARQSKLCAAHEKQSETKTFVNSTFLRFTKGLVLRNTIQ